MFNVHQLVISIPAFLLALSGHEGLHAWAADKLGDPTARRMGRVTLNPLAHIDPIGTVLFPLILIWAGIPPIGWAKPVMVNPHNLRHPRQDNLWISLAGPGANIGLAILSAFVFRLLSVGGLNGSLFWLEPLMSFLMLSVIINLLLAFFNLIPIPPLDGSGIIMGLLPNEYVHYYEQLRPFGFIIILALFWMGLVGKVLLPIVYGLAAIFLGGGFNG